jgi:hypothetical protein
LAAFQGKEEKFTFWMGNYRLTAFRANAECTMQNAK